MARSVREDGLGLCEDPPHLHQEVAVLRSHALRGEGRNWAGLANTGADLNNSVQSEIDQSLVWLAINEEGVSVLDHTTMQVTEKFSYTNIITFGGCQDDFMLVISIPETAESQKLLFETTKPKILEMTLLIADYMNMMGQILPLSHKSSQASSRIHSRSVSRSRLTSSTLTAINSAPNTPRLVPKDEKSSSLVRSGSTASYADKE